MFTNESVQIKYLQILRYKIKILILKNLNNLYK